MCRIERGQWQTAEEGGMNQREQPVAIRQTQNEAKCVTDCKQPMEQTMGGGAAMQTKMKYLSYASVGRQLSGKLSRRRYIIGSQEDGARF